VSEAAVVRDTDLVDVAPSASCRHVNLAILALAIGGFAIGTTEFVTMGLLPQIASGVGISIPRAGHVVSAYALGVVVGAPLIATLTARLSRRSILIWLMLAFAAANIASSMAATYPSLMVARFLSGMPHGAFFGIGAVVAASMVPRARRTWAVSMMLAGLTVANIIGVPLTTWVGQSFGWQWPYVLVAVIALVTVVATWGWVPHQPADGDASMRAEMRSLKRLQVWLALLIGTVGFGGMFATYSYIAPTMTDLTGYPSAAVPLILAIYGIGMTTGAFLSGRAAAYGLMRGIFFCLAAIAVILALFGFAAHNKVTAVLAVFLLGLVPTILVPMLQTRLMDVAHEGQSLAAALNHSTLNVANALGAWLGSVVLEAGYGYEWPSRVGVLLALAGLGIAAASVLADRRHTSAA
jgi:MFS transporter, DHA1 family, inner membrane transport protein